MPKARDWAKKKTKPIYIVLVLISCLCNAVSELLDKMLMQSMNSGQLQFWYMFFMVILYLGYMIVTKTKIDFRTIYKNYWILILSVLFVIGDKALFIACSKQESTVVAMTLIKTMFGYDYDYRRTNCVQKKNARFIKWCARRL